MNAVGFRFSLGEKVWISELKCAGRVKVILIDDSGTNYKVRFFAQGDPKEVYFYPDEVQSFQGQDQPVSGFSNLPSGATATKAEPT